MAVRSATSAGCFAFNGPFRRPTEKNHLQSAKAGLIPTLAETSKTVILIVALHFSEVGDPLPRKVVPGVIARPDRAIARYDRQTGPVPLAKAVLELWTIPV